MRVSVWDVPEIDHGNEIEYHRRYPQELRSMEEGSTTREHTHSPHASNQTLRHFSIPCWHRNTVSPQLPKDQPIVETIVAPPKWAKKHCTRGTNLMREFLSINDPFAIRCIGMNSKNGTIDSHVITRNRALYEVCCRFLRSFRMLWKQFLNNTSGMNLRFCERLPASCYKKEMQSFNVV